MPLIITIDGPAGSGKSTVAKRLAERLAIRFLNTGAMYRAVAVAVLRAAVNESDVQGVGRVASACHMTFDDKRLILNGDDVTDLLRTPEVDAVSSIIAANPAVRARLVELQREIGRQGSMVTEGRDQGTVVFPNAPFKFFITASLDARAFRRQQELLRSGSPQPIEVVMDELRLRDERDETRAHAPMVPAADSITIDTTDLSITQVVDAIVKRVRGG